MKKVIVTGTASGIGNCLALKLLALGVNVVGIDRKSSGINHSGYTHILQDLIPNELINNIDSLLDQFNSSDGLVNCAAITRPLPDSLEKKYELFRSTLSVNLESIYILSEIYKKTHLNSEIEKASIVNISSIAASQGFPDNPSYIASKAALEGLTRSLAYDYSNIGIRVNCVRPGYVETPMNINSLSDKNSKLKRSNHTLLKRWAFPEEIAEPVIFLLSSSSSYITGSILSVDGGWKIKGFHEDI